MTTDSAGQRQAQALRETWRIVAGGPERAFRIGAIATAGDVVLGSAIMLGRPSGRWSVELDRPAPSVKPAPSADLPDLSGLLGARSRLVESGASLEVAVTAELVNPMGNLHGGITLWISDLVAPVGLGDRGREPQRGRQQLLMRDHVVDQPDPQRGRRVHEVAGQ